jgi:hypothetical protein
MRAWLLVAAVTVSGRWVIFFDHGWIVSQRASAAELDSFRHVSQELYQATADTIITPDGRRFVVVNLVKYR